MTAHKGTIWDPLRRKEVELTPEEEVRQWFIRVLHESLGVPMTLMGSEVAMRFGSSSKSWRADIVVYGRSGEPLAVVECKRPEVELSSEVMEQALRYDMVLGVKYIFVTNGRRTRIAHRDAGSGNVVFLDTAPHYQQMLEG